MPIIFEEVRYADLCPRRTDGLANRINDHGLERGRKTAERAGHPGDSGQRQERSGSTLLGLEDVLQSSSMLNRRQKRHRNDNASAQGRGAGDVSGGRRAGETDRRRIDRTKRAREASTSW